MKKKPKNSGKFLVENLKNLCQGLVYLSETDAEFGVFVGEKVAKISKDIILEQTNSSPNILIEEKEFDDFFVKLTKIQDWYSTEQKLMANRFADLQKTLKENLINKKIFRIGKIQIDIYVVGYDAENNLVGVKTKAVET